MRKSKATFLIAEICLAILVIFFVKHIFEDEEPQKRVAVIVENSGDEKWDSFIYGLKQAADIENIHLIVCNTDEIENAEEEKSLIYEQMDNQVDAFIVQAAPGNDVLEMLQDVCRQKPVVLVVNDVFVQQASDNTHAESGLPKIMPDNYDMGYQLGLELLNKNDNDIKGKTVGIVNGLKDTEYAEKRRQGFLDALADSGCEISFDIYTAYDDDVAFMIKRHKTVDFMAVLETDALEQVGEMNTDENVKKTKLYGIGNSIKCVYYLDDGLIERLIMADGYDMGYNSIIEVSHVLENRFNSIKSYTTGYRVMKKEDIFTEEMQQFLRTYE